MTMMSTTEPDELLAPPDVPAWVVVSCSGHLFGVPLVVAREAVPPQPLTRLPGCAPVVAGLVSVRGRIHTVFDLGLALGLDACITSPDYRVVLLELDDRVIGIIVDRIVEIAHGFAAVLTEPPSNAGPLCIGSGRIGDRDYLALDIERILSGLLT